MKERLKAFIFLFLVLIFLSYATAFEFDNVKSYNETIREVTITNALGFGEDIGKARLNTPSIVKVGKGYQRVAEFEIVSYKEYDDILKQFSFKDLNTNKEIEKKIDIKSVFSKKPQRQVLFINNYLTNDPSCNPDIQS